MIEGRRMSRFGRGLAIAVAGLVGFLAQPGPVPAADSKPAGAKPVDSKAADSKPAAKVSYFRDVRPILQEQCQGCHQPAKRSGEYVMTPFASLLKGGESNSAAIVPGKPADSYLLNQITPAKGKAEMPKGKSPLAATQIDLIRRWIAEGAVDDTPASASVTFDAAHPPVYHLPPVLTSLDYSPDGSLLAVSGYHEVLLWKADGSAAGRSARGSFRADSIAGVFARWQEVGRGRRFARAARRNSSLGRRQAEAAAVGSDDLRHAVRRQLVARRHADRLRLRRQFGPRDRRQDGRSKSCFKAPTTIGCSARCLAKTLRIWSPSAAIAR